MHNATEAPVYRRILVALSLDDDALIVEVPKRGPILLTASSFPNAHARLRELVLDPAIPHRKGDASPVGLGDFFGEIGHQLSELGRDEGEPAELPPDPKFRRIIVALTVDADALLVEVPQRPPAMLREDRAFARLCELVRDPSVKSVPTDRTFNPRQFFRGAARAISELGKGDEKS